MAEIAQEVSPLEELTKLLRKVARHQEQARFEMIPELKEWWYREQQAIEKERSLEATRRRAEEEIRMLEGAQEATMKRLRELRAIVKDQPQTGGSEPPKGT